MQTQLIFVLSLIFIYFIIGFFIYLFGLCKNYINYRNAIKNNEIIKKYYTQSDLIHFSLLWIPFIIFYTISYILNKFKFLSTKKLNVKIEKHNKTLLLTDKIKSLQNDIEVLSKINTPITADQNNNEKKLLNLKLQLKDSKNALKNLN